MAKKYFTTTLPYVNSDPHIGFALELVQADAIARFYKLQGDEVFFNTGTDEHGIKIQRKALELSQDPQVYVDGFAEKFKKLLPALGISSDIHFIRTTDKHHQEAAQEFWRRCLKNDDIYKKVYQVKYCVGCELEKTDSDLEQGKCPLHPNLEIELIDEENYFFRFSKYQQALLDLYAKNPNFVMPDFRFNEIKQFVTSGLTDFSVSRLKSKMSWGIPVPDDDQQVMFVWFDALINYISTLNWPEKTADFNDYWGTKESPNAIQFAGKDNLRQQSAMWQAMLLSADLPTSKQIMIHGFITAGGQKMSKSLGNVADPFQILTDLENSGLSPLQAREVLRYYLLREIPAFEDGDYSFARLQEIYQSDLVNGLGNLASRVATMVEKYFAGEIDFEKTELVNTIADKIKIYRSDLALKELAEIVSETDRFLDQEKPWMTAKTDLASTKKTLATAVGRLINIAELFAPFLPETAEILMQQFTAKKIPAGSILFPRLGN